MNKWIVAALTFVAPVMLLSQAQPLVSSSSAVSWLEPTDAILTKAVDDGFSGKKLPKDAPYHKYVNRIKPGEELGARIEVIPPLVCAKDLGQMAHDKLESKPDLNYVKVGCLRKVTVNLIHFSQILNANWPCVFQKGDQTLQPSYKGLDENPDVVTYYTGFVAGDQAGYSYFDTYAFQFPQAMIDGASLVYADETGQHHTLNYDFSVFAKDVPRSGELPPAQASALTETMKQKITANSEAGKSSRAAAAALADVGHVQTPQEMAALVEAGKASKCAVVTDPPGAEIDVDGNKAGVSPMAFVLLKHGDTPRTITVKMSGYKTVEMRVVPDGKTIPIGLTLDREPQ
ncbi:MAG TPA: PEGA domain-containing protein [Terracidiphilus sp.]|jgi:hypothetical protein|nr:PEGA domain-containing protein [Terracidiphilus sp.]